MKNGAYHELYLEDAMKNLGEALEYGLEALNVEPDLFFHCFQVSGFALRWETGDPLLISGSSGTELFRRTLDKCGFRLDNKDALIKYDTGIAYWTGWITAYYQWESCTSFARIADALTWNDFIRIYPALHTVSEKAASEKIRQLIEKRRSMSRLQEYRKRIGLSQRQLAEASGVNLRTLQEYEVRRKEINKASADTLSSLAAALWCRPEALMEDYTI